MTPVRGQSITAGEFLDSPRSCQPALEQIIQINLRIMADMVFKRVFNAMKPSTNVPTYLLLGFEDQTWSSGPAASLRRSPAAAPVKRPRLWGSAPALAASCPPSKNAKITAETQRRSPSLMRTGLLRVYSR